MKHACMIALFCVLGCACTSVTYKEGEEVLLFAVKDIDGTYSTVGYYNGKSKIDAATYSDRAAEIKKAADRIAVDVSLKTTTSPEAGLEISILNKGADKLRLFDQGYPDVRSGYENLIGPKIESGYVVKLILLVVDSKQFGVTFKNMRKKAPDITLKKGECCTGRFDIRRIPIYSGKTTKVRIWASVGPHLSKPVEIMLNPKNTLVAKEVQKTKEAQDAKKARWSMNLKKKIIQQNAPADAKRPRR